MLTSQPMSPVWQSTIERWFENDMEGMRWMKFYAKPKKWLALLDNTHRWGWIILEKMEPIGFLDLEQENNGKAHFSFYLAPEQRRKRKGQILIQELLKQAKKYSITTLQAGVEADNRASIACLKKAGFKKTEADKDNLITFQRTL